MDWYCNRNRYYLFIRSSGWNNKSKGVWKLSTIKEQELEKINGGDSQSISGPVISAIVNIIKLIRDAGYDLGSGIRRASEGELCPLK